MAIDNIVRLPDGAQVNDFYAMVEQVLPAKEVKHNGSDPYVVQPIIVSDKSGRKLEFVTYNRRVSPDIIGKWILCSNAARMDWKENGGDVKRMVKGKFKLVQNGEANDVINPGPLKPNETQKCMNNNGTVYAGKDLKMAWESALKSSVSLVSGLVPLCRDASELKSLASEMKVVVEDIAMQFVIKIYSENPSGR